MKISVCIPTVRPTTVGAAIASVLRQQYEDLELIVVGQGFDPTLEKSVRDAFSEDQRTRYIGVERMNASHARNLGIDAAMGEVVAFFDDDCEAAPDWLQVIATEFARDPSLGVVGGAVTAPPAERPGPSVCPVITPLETLYDPRASGYIAPVGFEWGAGNVAIRRTVAQQVGPFDECMGPGTPFPGAEDPEWKLRIERCGVRMRTTPRSVVQHTYGRRYGISAGYRLMRNYARGAGAHAAKLGMQGDQRAAQRLRASALSIFSDPKKVPQNLMRAYHVFVGYIMCRSGYRLDQSGTLLVPKG